MMQKVRIAVLATITLVFAGTVTWFFVKKSFMNQYLSHFSSPPVTVSSARATTMRWQKHIDTVGTVVASNDVAIAPEVSGQVQSISVHSGSPVVAGALLVKLDTQLDEQQLTTDLAALHLAQLSVVRQGLLLKRGATARAQYDASQAQYEQAQARVKSDQVTLQKKYIRAPFSGRVGIRQVSVGDYVTPGQMLIHLVADHPMYVNFMVPVERANEIQVGNAVIVSSEDKVVGKAVINAKNVSADTNSRMLEVQAALVNGTHPWQPGSFVRVSVLLPQWLKQVTVPTIAVTPTILGDGVYVLKEHGKQKGVVTYQAKQAIVKTGEIRGNRIAIISGLSPNDQVATAGQFKLTNGALVVLNNKAVLNEQ